MRNLTTIMWIVLIIFLDNKSIPGRKLKVIQESQIRSSGKTSFQTSLKIVGCFGKDKFAVYVIVIISMDKVDRMPTLF